MCQNRGTATAHFLFSGRNRAMISCMEEFLTDIGLSESQIARFVALCGNKKAQIRLLEEERNKILSAVHEEEKRIEQIDYLIYEIKRS